MEYILNGILLVVVIVATMLLFYVVFRRKLELPEGKVTEQDFYELKHLIPVVRERFRGVFNQNIAELNLNETETLKKERNKARLKKATRKCSFGDIGSKEYVKDFIKEILETDLKIDREKIQYAIPFFKPESLSVAEKYDILLYSYKKKFRFGAFAQLCSAYGWDNLKKSGTEEWYEITAEDIEVAFEKESPQLEYRDMVELLAQRIYQQIYGHGVIDELRDMQIDGVSGGVSGYTSLYQYISDMEEEFSANGQKNYESVWVFFQGKTIHLSFLGFDSQQELERVCKNIYRYDSPGQLSAASGYIVNDMEDGSRVVVVRPGFAESWAFFVRKFNSVTSTKIEELITDKGSSQAIEMIQYLVKGCQVIAITGDQGSGKTTLLKALIQFIEKSYPIRIQEQVFETWMRKIYPDRNILTMRETGTISAQDGINLAKKTDGTVCILGEVASYELASLVIQLSQAGTKMTMCTNHSITTERLIAYFRNAILKTEGFNSERSAEEQVVEALNFDIHMAKDRNGHRYIERITEIIPALEESSFEGTDSENLKQFFEQMTRRKSYRTEDIIRYTPEGYQMVNPLSDMAAERILRNLSEQDKVGFRALQGQGG